MRGKLVGIDIGRGTVKIVCGSLKKGEFKIKGYRIFKTPKHAFMENGSINEKVFLEDDTYRQIPGLIKDMGCKGKNCSISISGKNIILRERKLPFVAEKELGEIVKLEAQSFLPGPSEEFVVDYRVIDKVEEGGGELLKVLIVAAPIDLVNSYISLVSKAGLKVSAVDIGSSCITNYAKRYILDEDFNTLIVDIGYATTRFVMYNGMNYFAELEVDIGGNEATMSIANFLETDEVEVEHKKLKKGKMVKEEDMDLSLSDEEMYFNLGIKKTYERIAQEISRVMDYYRTRRFSSKIDKVVIIGGGANLSGAAEYIQSIAGVPVNMAEIPQGFKENFAEDQKKEDFLAIIPVIGSVLRG